MAKWITKSEYARLYGLNRSSVTKAVQAGRLPTRGEKVAADVDIRRYRRREPANDDIAFRPKAPAAVPPVAPAAGGDAPSRRMTGARRLEVAASDIPDEDLGLELQRARIDKLNADIAVQRQNWRREDLAEFSGAFSESFAPFKNALVKLRLSAEELQNLGRAWDKCYKAFLSRLEDMEAAESESDSPDQ